MWQPLKVEKCREMIIAHACKIVYNGNTESAKKKILKDIVIL